MEKDVRRIEIFLVLAVIGTFFFLGSSITGFISYVTNFSYETNYTLVNNTIVDVYIYDSNEDSINFSGNPSDMLVGNYYVFDGVSDTVTFNRAGDVDSLNNGYTFKGWFKRLGSGLDMGVARLSSGVGLLNIFLNSSGSLLLNSSIDGVSQEICPDSISNTNDWIMWTITWENATNYSIAYCNGVLNSNITNERIFNIATSGQFRLGQVSGLTNVFFNGYQDEVEIYTIPLNESTVSDIYDDNLAGLHNTYVPSATHLIGNITVPRLGSWVGDSWSNIDVAHRYGLPTANTWWWRNGVPQDDARYTISDWKNQSYSSWGLEANRSISGMYLHNMRVGYIETGNGTTNVPEFNLSTGGTMNAFVYLLNATTETHIKHTIFQHSNTTENESSTDFWLEVGNYNASVDCVWKTQNGTETAGVSTGNYGITFDEWHMISCTTNGSTRKLYIDGVDVSNVNFSASSFGGRTYPLKIGSGRSADTLWNFAGEMDEVALDDRAWTSAEILEQYNRVLNGQEINLTGLLLQYSFEQQCHTETTPNCIVDTSGNNRHAEMNTASPGLATSIAKNNNSFPEIALIVCTTGGISIFNETGDLWQSFKSYNINSGIGYHTRSSCMMKNGLLCMTHRDAGVRCLDFTRDVAFRHTTSTSGTGNDIARYSPAQTISAGTYESTNTNTIGDMDMYSIGNHTYIGLIGSNRAQFLNTSNHKFFYDTITDGADEVHISQDGSLIYIDGTTLSKYEGLVGANFTPTYTVAFSNVQALSSNDTRIYVGNSTDLFSYNLTLQDPVNHTNLLNGVNNVTDLEVLADRWLWVSTAPEGNISEINLSSNTTRTSLFDIFPSRNFTALSVYVNDSDSSSLGAYEGCESSGLVAVGSNESGASLVDWTGLYCTNESPTIDQVVLTSNSTYNLTTGNLSVSFVNVSDREGDAVMNITDWRVNGTSIAVVYLPFEGGSNSTFTKDYTTYKNNGSVSGAVFNNFGGFDSFGAYEFDGTAKTITVPFSADLSDEYTISFRVNTTNNETGQIQGVVSIGNSSHALRMFINPSSMEFDISPGEIGNLATPIERNEWRFYAAVWDGSSSYLYEDGTLVATSSANMSFPGATSITLSWSVNEYFNGTLDDFRVFNRSLSYDQIVRIYSNQTNVTVHNETVKGEVWSACITPNDRVQDGDEVCSNDLTILNSAPTIDEVQLNSSEGDNLTDEDLFLTLINVSDDDGDEVKNISDWQLYNGTGFESIALVNLPFEGGSNSTITRDYSTFKRNGTVSSAVFNATGGFDGFGAYMFNGASRTISVPFSANMSQQYTVSFWVNTTNNETGQIQGVVSIGNSSHALRMFINPSSMEFDIFPGEIGNLASPIERNEWKFYAAVWDGSSSYLYEDGTLITTSSANMSFPGATSFTLSWPVNEYFNGTLDEVRVFNRSLSADQIELLYNNDVLTLSSYETESPQIWQGCVTPNDRTNDGPTVCSNNLTVDTVTIDIAFLKGTLDCTMAIYQDFDEATFYTCGDIASVNGVIECDLDDDGNSSITIPTTSSSCDIGNPNYGAIVVYNNGTNVSLNVSLLNLTVGGIENAVMQIDTYIFNAVSAPGCNGASCNNCPSADTTGCFLDLNSTTSEPNSTIECDHFKRDSAVCECFSIHVEDADTVHQLKNGSQVSFVVQKTAVPEPPEVCS